MERFAKAIYNGKNNRRRGRFVNFFAEEILNISQTQLWRINALEKLTENVRQAVDDKKISETAAVEMSNMSEEKQEECLEQILSGEMKGTVKEIQNFKTAPKVEKAEIPNNEGSIENPINALQNFEPPPEENLIGVPEEFEDPQKEAEEWYIKEILKSSEKLYEEAKRNRDEERDELKAAQWGIRASVVRYKIEEMKLQNK